MYTGDETCDTISKDYKSRKCSLNKEYVPRSMIKINVPPTSDMLNIICKSYHKKKQMFQTQK